MVFAPEGASLTWKQAFVENVKNLKYHHFVWDTYPTNVKNIVDYISKLLQKNDIILSCMEGSLFFWASIATIFYLDEHDPSDARNRFCQAATWGKPTIIGPIYDDIQHSLDESLMSKEIVHHVATTDQLIEKTLKILKDDALKTKIHNNAISWIKQVSDTISNKLIWFIAELQKIMHSKKNSNDHH